MPNRFERFFGGPPLRIVLRLALISLVVGVVLSAFDIHLFDIVRRLHRLALTLWQMGFGAVELVAEYLLIGAVLVVPIWLVLRLLDRGRH